jgi:hypothetical protein
MQDVAPTEGPNVCQRKREDSDGRAVAGHHLNRESVAILIPVHDRPDVALAQAMLWHVSLQGNEIELGNCPLFTHHVTSRGTP